MTFAAVVLGVGIGGFFDGIVFHQILQWHHVLSAPVPPDSVANLQVNTLADGLFHGATWVVTLVGLWLLVRSWPDASSLGGPVGIGRRVAGGLLAGWGGFNLVEGIVDHYVLGIHHVRAGADQAVYDAVFLAWGAVFLAVGAWVLRVSARRAAPRR